MSEGLRPFHLAIPVTDLAAAEAFYCDALGCGTGRRSERWVDLDFYGHQLVLHQVDTDAARAPTNPVDGDEVPVPHFGVVLDMPVWKALADRLTEASIAFVIAPRTRFAGEIGEQATMFFHDPSGNALEFKSFANPSQLFAS